MNGKRVAVIIPSWNGRDLTLTCLDSLSKQTFQDFHVIVVDDASTDDTASAVAHQFPTVDLLRFAKNGGFCAAVNAGIYRANADLIVLLNNDITLEPDCLEQLVNAADRHAGDSLFAPLILWQDAPDTIYSAGDAQLANGRPEPIGFNQPSADFAFRHLVFGVSAAAALYRREVFARVGLFDERFNTYFSDSDLNFRARLFGFKAQFVRQAVCYHIGSASLMGKTLKRTQQCYVNHLLLLIKNMPAPLYARHALAIAHERYHQAKRLFSAARCESGARFAVRTVLSALWQTIGLLPYAIRQRWRIQTARSISLHELEEQLGP